MSAAHEEPGRPHAILIDDLSAVQAQLADQLQAQHNTARDGLTKLKPMAPHNTAHLNRDGSFKPCISKLKAVGSMDQLIENESTA